MHEKLKDALVLLAEIAGLLVVFIVFLLFLNFFNILSLSTIYPNQLGFLPHLNQTSVITNHQSPALANFVKLTNEASDAQMQKYETYATRFSKPTTQANPNNYVSDAVFSGYDSKTIQVVTKEGVLNLSYDQNTLFQKQPDPSTQTNNATNSGLLPKPIVYITSADFFKNVQLGSVLQISFPKPDLKTTRVIYIESIKPIF